MVISIISFQSHIHIGIMVINYNSFPLLSLSVSYSGLRTQTCVIGPPTSPGFLKDMAQQEGWEQELWSTYILTHVK